MTSMQQCPDGIQLGIGHSQPKQGKYNSAYSIVFVVYTCLNITTKNCGLHDGYLPSCKVYTIQRRGRYHDGSKTVVVSQYYTTIYTVVESRNIVANAAN
ncbi:hypothetical protein TIFTF001_054434 [Ficus carica]|uniref:Uncharacterized protein n=1 Tax=Ficus carica TaxID=3494 RepID=A0AA88JJH9_FICCA|nr:hypothetical protein TIFTF001_054434 [Ficus carica]